MDVICQVKECRHNDGAGACCKPGITIAPAKRVGPVCQGYEADDRKAQEAERLFEALWKLYPLKRGKAQVTATDKKKLARIGQEEMQRAMDRYQQELARQPWRSPQNGGRFFKTGYMDYLDANYVPEGGQVSKQSLVNKFNNFPAHQYDFDALEKALLK